MNRIISIIALVIAVAVGVLHFVGQKKSTVAYINTPKLINEYEGMKAARVVFQQKQQAMQANVDTLMSEMEQSLKKFERERPTLSEKELALSQQLLQSKRQQLMQYQQATQQKIKEEENKLNESVMAQINAFLKTYGEGSGYEIILGATNMGNIIYAQDYMDITDEAIEGLNKEYLGE